MVLTILNWLLSEFLPSAKENDDGNNNFSILSFYMPQILSIHNKMLPPLCATHYIVLDLYEDFLLTLGCSDVNFALGLVWHLMASLEDESGADYTRKKFALRRLICEFESVLFGFDNAWGGGSVALLNRNNTNLALNPSPDQEILLNERIAELNNLRLKSPFQLSKSTRANLLRGEDDNNVGFCGIYHAQINFQRQLSHIASTLFTLPRGQHSQYLETELQKINESGCLGIDLGCGGSPVSRIVRLVQHYLQSARYVGRIRANFSFFATLTMIRYRVPSTEGHVFRSKARTPVLLLIEVVAEGDDGAESDNIGGDIEAGGSCDLAGSTDEVVYGDGHRGEDFLSPYFTSLSISFVLAIMLIHVSLHRYCCTHFSSECFEEIQ